MSSRVAILHGWADKDTYPFISLCPGSFVVMWLVKIIVHELIMKNKMAAM